jgi:hypothetical protein
MYVEDYRRLGIQRIKGIYRAYAGIIENLDINEALRNDLTGIIFENEKTVFTFKLYYPATYQDSRLTYIPIEIDRIGKNKKTSIPVKVYGITSGYDFNVLDSQIKDTDVYESMVYENNLVFDSNV